MLSRSFLPILRNRSGGNSGGECEITCEGLKTFDLKYLGTGLYFFISKENQLLGKLIVE